MRHGDTEARARGDRGAVGKRRRRWRDRMRPGCGALAASAVLLTASVCGRAPAGGAKTPLEDAGEAACLCRFGQFVEWPADTFKEPSAPFIYCTIGDDPFHGALERTLNGKTIGQ